MAFFAGGFNRGRIQLEVVLGIDEAADILRAVGVEIRQGSLSIS